MAKNNSKYFYEAEIIISILQEWSDPYRTKRWSIFLRHTVSKWWSQDSDYANQNSLT